MNYLLDSWDRYSSAIDEHVDQTVEVAMLLPDHVAAAALVDELRANPYAHYCRRRGCGHLARHHEGDICVYPGCECEGLRL